MSDVLGNPWAKADLFPESRVSEVLLLILDTWLQFRKPIDSEREPAITERFGVDLASANRHKDDMFALDWEAPSYGKPAGRIDFRFMAGKRTEVYLGFEAKKLNRNNGKDNAKEYVCKKGMGRFIVGKYSPNQEHGGMIGYVMDGNCNQAIANVRREIKIHVNDLKIRSHKSQLRKSIVLKKSPHVYESTHVLDDRTLTLHHVMLAA